MIQPCETCGRDIADGATICAACAHRLDNAIADVSAYHGLAYDLDLATTRQAKLGQRAGGRPTTVPVPWDDRASRAAKKLKDVLAKWANIIHEETGAGQPPEDLAKVAAYLRRWGGWLRHHPDGGQAYDEVLDAVRAARRVVDRPAERLYAGPCDCGADLYARLGAAYVECHNEAHPKPIAWEVDARRRWLLRSAEDVLATTTEISRALTRYSQPVTPSAIRGYVARGRLFPKGEQVVPGRKDPVPLYRLGDVLKIVAPEGERVSA